MQTFLWIFALIVSTKFIRIHCRRCFLWAQRTIFLSWMQCMHTIWTRLYTTHDYVRATSNTSCFRSFFFEKIQLWCHMLVCNHNIGMRGNWWFTPFRYNPNSLDETFRVLYLYAMRRPQKLYSAVSFFNLIKLFEWKNMFSS